MFGTDLQFPSAAERGLQTVHRLHAHDLTEDLFRPCPAETEKRLREDTKNVTAAVVPLFSLLYNGF